jgi:hypothetical protein
MENRFFSKIDIGIQSGRGELTDKKDRNPLWRGYAKDRVLTSAQKNVVNTMSETGTPGAVASTMANVMDRIGGAFSGFNDNADFDVNMKGLYTSEMAVDVGSNKIGLYGEKNCQGKKDDAVFSCIRRHNVILADGWSASSKEQAESRTSGMVLMGVFSKIEGPVHAVGSLPGFSELKGFEPGYVDSDVIAPDRVGK